MRTIGIIAEYNPFHNGHAYQLAQAKKETGADYAVIAMSGDFLQRGTPAIADKYIRAQMALASGADLVLEIPALWSVSSAEYYARAGVQCLASTGVVDSICYGCESVQPELVSTLAAALTQTKQSCQAQNTCPPHTPHTQNHEPNLAGQTPGTDSKHTGQARSTAPGSVYHTKLTELLRQGASYPLARQEALCCALPGIDAGEIRSFLSSPNNILALEYEKAIAGWNAAHAQPLRGHAIRRAGDGYHSTEIHSRYASATALRGRILAASSLPTGLWEDLSCYLPAASLNLLRSTAERRQLMDADDFSGALYSALLANRDRGYARFADVTEALSRRIGRRLNEFLSFTQFAGLLKTKEMTHTRITRSLAHIMLGFTPEDMDSDVPYLRLLGFRRSAAPLLSEIHKKASAPLVTKVADASRSTRDAALRSLQRDIHAADLYRGICSIKSGLAMRNEYTQPLIILP